MNDDVVIVDEGNEISLIVRTADQTRKAEIAVPTETSFGDIISEAINNWSMDKDVDYTITNISNGTSLDPNETIGKANLENGNILEIQPVLVAGNGSK